MPQDETSLRVDDSMKMAGIYEYRERAPHNLSGGQKQRVAIAGVVAMRPDCLILDEATAMLDPSGRADVLATVRKLNREQGMTIVLITHSDSLAEETSRIFTLMDGEIIGERRGTLADN